MCDARRCSRAATSSLALLARKRISATLGGRRRGRAPRALTFPRDFGAHPESRIEWWYITGMLTAAARTWGFQITFFRTATGIVGADASAFRAGDLVFAHAAVTDLAEPPPAARPAAGAQRLRHRRGGDRATPASCCATGASSAAAAIGERSRYRMRAASETAGFRFELELATTQPVLLQGERGLSRKGPEAAQFSRYYSQPQLR